MYSIQLAVYGTALATRTWLRNHMSERGATAVEYGLLVGLIAVVIATAVLTLGQGLNGLFGSTSKCIGGANTAAQTSGSIASGSCPA